MGNNLAAQSYTFDGLPACWSDTMAKQPDIEKEVYVTLEEIYHGCIKRMRITRKVMQSDGTVRQEDKMLMIDIRPGWLDGTRVRFPREGDQLPKKIPADIVFTVRVKPHRLFKRNGNDIYYIAKISLQHALCGTRLEIPTLSGERVLIDMRKDVVNLTTISRVVGRGLPDAVKPFRKGDLYVVFDIKFPSYMSQRTKDKLIELMKTN